MTYTKSIKKMCMNITVYSMIGIFIFSGCSGKSKFAFDPKEATLLPYSGKEIYDLYNISKSSSAPKGERIQAQQEIKKIEKNVYYTYRTGMYRTVWKEKSELLPLWGATRKKEFISKWIDDLRPVSEVKLVTYTPIIYEYVDIMEAMELDISRLKSILEFELPSEGSDKVEWKLQYGDAPPTAFRDGEYIRGFFNWNNSLFSFGSTIFIRDEGEALRLVIKLRAMDEFRVKVYYRILDGICSVVKVDCFDKENQLVIGSDFREPHNRTFQKGF